MQRSGDRSIMLGNPLKRFPGKVQPVKLGIMAFKICDDTNRLSVMIKPPKRRHQCIQSLFARMAKWRMPQIMRQRHRFRQFRV